MIHDNDAWWDMKQRGYQRPLGGFKPIHMPKNTGAGVILAALRHGLGFALIWHIWWLAAVSFVALIATAIGHTFNYNRDFHIPADEVARTEKRATPNCSRPGRAIDVAYTSADARSERPSCFHLADEHAHPGGTAPCSASGST